ncbi:MAG: TetR/AcrR family transcriptional regulator [Pseudomonadota bacterium]|jgi:AcrR family transcriptional regulator|nr:TetR/AcrR family transcriptional regulator [Pseudomonadota bacterium]
MIPIARGRPSSRERILDAAEELVREVGAGRLTLDAVAERASLSKGGLLYNFPSKDALLQGMLERLIATSAAEREALRSELAGQRNAEVRAAISAALKIRCNEMKGFANGILAASAENPRLLEPVRVAIREQWEAIKANSDDLDLAVLAWLAVEGLSSLEMHDLSPFSPADRERVIAAVQQFLDRDGA